MRFRHAALLTVLMLAAIGADTPSEPSTAKLLKAFQGTWSIESIETEGVVNREAMAQARYEFRGDKYSLTFGDQVVETGTFKLDVDGRDWTIDLNKSGEKIPTGGIYEFHEGKLRICFAPPGELRPHAYQGRDGHHLLILTRPKTSPKSE